MPQQRVTFRNSANAPKNEEKIHFWWANWYWFMFFYENSLVFYLLVPFHPLFILIQPFIPSFIHPSNHLSQTLLKMFQLTA
jgi:hypothetical protein